MTSVTGPVADDRPTGTAPGRPSVTVVIVTWNSSHNLGALAATLPAATTELERVRVVVVDNASTDGTPEQAGELWPDADVVRTGRNGGYAAGINVGARLAAPEDVVVVMNPDLRLHPGCLRRLCDALAEPEVGVAFPRLVDEDGHTSPSLRREPTVARVWAESLLGGTRAARRGWGETVADPASYARDHDVEWATGALVAVSPECRAAVGDWDESFFLYSEEVDFCRRARRAGFRLRYVADARATHVGGPYGSDVALWRTLVRNRAIDFGRHHDRVTSAMFCTGLAAGQLLRAPRSASHRAAVLTAVNARERRTPERAGREPGVIWFAAQDWWYHNQAHSDFQLARHVAVDRKVLVVNSLGLRMPRKGVSTGSTRRILRKVRSMAKLVRRPVPEQPGFYVMTPLLLPFYGDNPGARLNAWMVRQQVRAVALLIGLRGPAHIGVTIPTAWPVVEPMARSSLVFNRSDLQSAFPEADGGWVASLEDQLLRHSDRVLYVSHELMRLDRAEVGARAYFLDHGADVDHFDMHGETAPEIQDIPGPRVGFFGGIDDYVVDLDLIRTTAERLPDVQLVLIGDATCPIDDLTTMPNVHWLGYRPYDAIPALGRGFDVAIMPWLDNEWIRFANPIKLKEYLALGLPVVTTEYPEVDSYRDRVWVAESRDDFPALVRAALSDPGAAGARRVSVLDATWQARATELTALLAETRERRCAG